MFNGFVSNKPDAKKSDVLWMLDRTAFNPVYDWAGTETSVNAGNYYTKLNVTGEEGFLVFCQASSNDRQPDIRLTIDGVQYIFEGNGNTGGNTGNLITFPIYFKTSLRIEARNSAALSRNLKTDYTYYKKIAIPNPSKQTLLLASARSMAMVLVASTSPTDLVNITGAGYLESIYMRIAGSTSSVNLFCTIIVDGTTIMNGRAVDHSQIGSNKQSVFLGAIRFNTSLRIQYQLDTTTGANVVARAWYTLD